MTTRGDVAAALVAAWGDGGAHQCPECGYGPVEHFACGDLTESRRWNRCPRRGCGYRSANISGWPTWDGTLPDHLRKSVEGRFACPFFRTETTAKAALVPKQILLERLRTRLRALRGAGHVSDAEVEAAGQADDVLAALTALVQRGETRRTETGWEIRRRLWQGWRLLDRPKQRRKQRMDSRAWR